MITIRELSLRGILKARELITAKKYLSFNFLIFILKLISLLQFDRLIETTDLQTTTQCKKETEISNMISSGYNLGTVFPEVPLYTNAVERFVELITKTALSGCGSEAISKLYKNQNKIKVTVTSYSEIKFQHFNKKESPSSPNIQIAKYYILIKNVNMYFIATDFFNIFLKI